MRKGLLLACITRKYFFFSTKSALASATNLKTHRLIVRHLELEGKKNSGLFIDPLIQNTQKKIRFLTINVECTQNM